MKPIRILLLITFLLIHACASKELPDFSLEEVPILVDNVSSMDTLKINNSLYIPLETSKECLIGAINKAFIKDSRIYVADFHKAITLFVFDMNGKLIFKISRMGRGPGEYISFRDFDIHSNGDIYMFDHFGKKFIVFSAEGEFKREFSTDYYLYHFCLVGDKMYWSILTERGKKFADLAVYDPKNGKTEFLLKGKRFLLGNSLYNTVSYRFYQSPSGITYYSPRFSEVIYAIDEGGVCPTIGIPKMRIPPEHVIKEWELKNHGLEVMAEDNVYFKENTNVYETDRHIAFKFINGKLYNSHYLIYDKQNLSFKAVPDFFFAYYLGVDGIMGSDGKNFFSVMNPDTYSLIHKKILKSRKELANWKEEDNPVIVIFDLDI